MAASGGKISGMQADISSLNGAQKLFAFVDQELAGLDILVNNAGIALLGHVADIDPEQWKQSLATNLSGVFYCCREAIARFRQRGSGFIVNIGSLLGKTAVAGGAAYCTSKFGLNGLSEAMLLDCRQEKIGVCTVGVEGSVPSDVDSAIVRVQQGVLRNIGFEPGNSRVGMDGRDASVRPDDGVRSQSHYVAAIAGAEERVRD